MQLGKKIQFLREQNNYSQKQFSDFINVPLETVQKWENCEIEPDVHKLKYISNFLNVSLDELLDLEVSYNEDSIYRNDFLENLTFFVDVLSFAIFNDFVELVEIQKLSNNYIAKFKNEKQDTIYINEKYLCENSITYKLLIVVLKTIYL